MWQLCRCGTLAVVFKGLLPAESHNTSLRVTSRPGACPDTDSMTPALKQQRMLPNDRSFSQCHISAASSWLQRQLHKHSSDAINILWKWLQKIRTEAYFFFSFLFFPYSVKQLWWTYFIPHTYRVVWYASRMVLTSPAPSPSEFELPT